MKKIFITTFLLLLANPIHAEIIVIGNKNNPLAFSSAQVADIFMGRNRALSNGQIAIPLDQSELRTEFYSRLINQPIEQINAYWTRIVLTDQISSPDLPKPHQPPKILLNDKEVLNAINENKNAISYIDKKNFDNSVRILLVIN